MKLKKESNGNIKVLEDDDSYSGLSYSNRLIVSGIDAKTVGGGVIIAFGNKNDAPAAIIRKLEVTQLIRADLTTVDPSSLTIEQFSEELDEFFFFHDLGGAQVTSDLSDFSDVTPLFLKDQISPTNLADISTDGNYCVRNDPADLAAQGITGHTNGDILKRTGGVWSFVLTPVAGVTRAFIKDILISTVFMDDPEADSPLFSEVIDDGGAFSVFALARDLTGVISFDGTTITGNKVGGLVTADFNNAAVLVVSAIVPYWIEDTVNPERSGVYNIDSNDTGTGDYTLRRDYRFRGSSNFTDGQTFFISFNGGTEAGNNYIIALDQQFTINTDALSIVLGKVSNAANAATVATEEFANTDARFFGELGLPGSQTGWVESGTGVISLVSDNVFGVIKDVVKNFSTTGNSTKSEIPITAADWLNVLTFGASFSGKTRITEDTIAINAMFAGMGFSAVNDPRPTSIRSRVGVFISVDAIHTIVTLDGQAGVILDGTGGNPLVLKNDWFTWDAFIKPTPDAGVNFGAVDVYVNGVIIVTGGIVTSNNAVDDEISIANSSSSGQTTFYVDNFGATILEESTIKTLQVTSMAADIVQVIIPSIFRDFEVVIPDNAGRKLGNVLSLVLNNVGGNIKLRTTNLGAPQALINGLREVDKFISKTEIIQLVNTIEGGNVYEGGEFNSGIIFHHSGIVSIDQLGVNPLSILDADTFRIAPIHNVIVDRSTNTTFPDINHMFLAQTDHTITGGGDQIIHIRITKQGEYDFTGIGPEHEDVTESPYVGKVVMDAGVIVLVIFTPIIAYAGSVDGLSELIGRGGQKTTGSIVSGNGNDLTIGVTDAHHEQLGRGFLVNPNTPNQCETLNESVFAFTGTQGSLFLSYVDGSSNFIIDSIQQGATPLLDVDRFNNAGTLASVSPNNFTAIRLFQFCQTGDIVAYYGNVEYANLAAAEAGFESEITESFDATGDGSWICTVLVKENATRLDATGVAAGDVKFINRSGRRDF